MNNTEKFLIDVLRCFVTGTETKLNTDGVDPQELLSLSKQHSVAGIVACILSKQTAFWNKGSVTNNVSFGLLAKDKVWTVIKNVTNNFLICCVYK